MSANEDMPVTTLPGIGPVTQGWLAEAGIGTVRALRAIGSVEAYRRLRFMGTSPVTLNALYALEAALRGCHWLELPESVKSALQAEARTIDTDLRKGMAPRCGLR